MEDGASFSILAVGADGFRIVLIFQLQGQGQPVRGTTDLFDILDDPLLKSKATLRWFVVVHLAQYHWAVLRLEFIRDQLAECKASTMRGILRFLWRPSIGDMSDDDYRSEGNSVLTAGKEIILQQWKRREGYLVRFLAHLIGQEAKSQQQLFNMRQ